MREVFNIFDVNHSGFIEPFELKAALRAIGFDVKKADVREIIDNLRNSQKKKNQNSRRFEEEEEEEECGNSRRDFLNFEEFTQVVTTQLSSRNIEDEISRAFSLFDPQNTGKIGVEQLRVALAQLGEGKKIKDDELQGLIDIFDTDGDGFLNYEEYRAILVGK
ncbi:Centrin-3 [Tritrichomonas foetus]|uniref:Centrin-3 n=1 Tax=Tritrichomonas foetus TaxID=1144522 RepID=A0A1J4JND6_9EUKA|nr:Centrin-3 [Tritrichomonas foetus]|eukprot:OHS98772.1 Centrin-3 [Tritrichomonas foetus]